MKNKYPYARIPEEEYNKYVGQLRLLFANLLQPLRLYGLDVEVDRVLPYLIGGAEEFGMKVRGKQQPYTIPSHLKED